MDLYKTPVPQPAQQRAVSTTSMEAKDCDPAPLHFSGSSRSPADRLLEDDAAFRSSIASLTPLAQLQHCLSALGGPGTSLTDPDNEVALDLLITILDAAMQGERNPCLQYVPASCYPTLRYAAQSALNSIRRCMALPPSPSPRGAAPPGPALPKNPLQRLGLRRHPLCCSWSRSRPRSPAAQKPAQ